MVDPITGAVAGSAIEAAGKTLQGTVKAVGSLFGGGARRREQRRAKAELGQMKEKYNQLDTSNPYANISNPYQNLTVNTQAADFAAQQTSQNSANIMSGLAAAAGGSGIAALAQSMANSQAQQTQQASASIAQQESKNQIMAAQGENQRQIAVAKGEESSRQMEADKVGTQLGMAQSRLTAANEARAAAKADLVGGIGEMAGGAAGVAVSGQGIEDLNPFQN